MPAPARTIANESLFCEFRQAMSEIENELVVYWKRSRPFGRSGALGAL